jgi:hypothetical protein
MRKILITALLSSLILTTPALAIHGISEDGASMMTAYNDPYAIPIGNPTHVRYGVVNFRCGAAVRPADRARYASATPV